MAFDYSKLRGRIIEKFKTYSAFADHLHTSKQTVSLKLSGAIQFNQTDVVTWCEALEIDLNDSGQYFFAPRVKSV